MPIYATVGERLRDDGSKCEGYASDRTRGVVCHRHYSDDLKDSKIK
jgi:hypothetical protein